MRWEQQSLDGDPQPALPGYSDAVVRHFDAPDAVDTRFYEVRAKTILNRVPEATQMPFRWTINAYRGCTHACVYCAWGGTPILMGDGTHKPMEKLLAGDTVYGTVRTNKYRQYSRTTVLAMWTTVKPAFRITLADGTELIASGDHRFLSNRGWKHVTASGRGQQDRPHLTMRNSLVGTGGFAPQPTETSQYRRGYLAGMIRGDGHIGEYLYKRGNRAVRAGGFRLALVDLEALWRTRAYLREEGVETNHRIFQVAAGNRREAQSIYTGLGRAERIEELIEWPVMPSLDWLRGFLAGIFDAEGSRSHFVLRIANTDPEILRWIDVAARRLGFDTSVDRSSNANGLASIRIRGGLSEHLRFFHLTDPAIGRKRSIEGQVVKTVTNLRVESIEPIGELPLYDITTGTGDFIANGVVSHNCFARPTHEYLDFNAGRDFEREIVVKVNAPERLRVELSRPSWQGEHVALGTNTDPYQWVEGRYELMPGIWEAFRDARNPCSVLTKSPLLLRDLALMRELNAVTEFSAALSIPTIDRNAWRETEPRSPNPRARLEAVAELRRAGIRTGVLVAPLMPGINDNPEQVAEVVRLATEAGASFISGIALHLRRGVREVFMEWLSEHRPELVERYAELYRRGAYAPVSERRRLTHLIQAPDRSIRTPNREDGEENEFQRGRSRRGSGPPQEPQNPRSAGKTGSNRPLHELPLAPRLF